MKDETGFLNPQEIVALSSLATFKGKSIKNLIKDIEKKRENLSERIKVILQRSSLRGHASIATTPAISLTYEGSKFLDSALTGIVFSSSLVSSGRRTETSPQDIVFPDKISSNKKAKEIYSKTSERIINFFNSLLEKGIPKDEASKILQYGIYGTGIIHLPVESIVGLKREYESEREWMPEEIGILLREIEKKLKNLGLDWLYATREAAPRNIYPYPNIFKGPDSSNLTRELRYKEKLSEGTKLISVDILTTPGLKKKLDNLAKKIGRTFHSLKQIKKDWLRLIALRQEIFRDYNGALRIRVLSTIPWRIWGEKKRHRTCPQTIESIYYCVERAAKKFNKFKKQIRGGKISKNLVKEIEEVFSIPPSIKRALAKGGDERSSSTKQKSELLAEYLLVALWAFEGYQNLLKLKTESRDSGARWKKRTKSSSLIKPREAIFLIPRAVKIDVLQEYDLYNLLTGYYPLRLCQTAEEEMRRNTLKEVLEIKKALTKRGYGWLNKFIVPKCQIVGFCPEEKSCGMILNAVKNYNKKFHQRMKEELKNKFQENLKKLGRR